VPAVSCHLSAHRRSLLEHPVPAEELGLPHGRLTDTPRRAGPQRDYHVPHERDTTGVGALSTPRTVVLTRPEMRLRPAPAASQQPVPGPHLPHPIGGASPDEASSRVHGCSPVRSSPSPVAAGWNSNPWASSPELRTPPLPATHVRSGTGHRTRTRTTPPTSSTSNRCNHSTRATSCRTAERGLACASSSPRDGRERSRRHRWSPACGSRLHHGRCRAGTVGDEAISSNRPFSSACS
jgi:hypothetical protein